jgi:hypothetical protein
VASRRERAEPAVDFDALLELLLFKILNTTIAASLYIPLHLSIHPEDTKKCASRALPKRGWR